MAWINMLESIYPVGAVYISTVSTSPASFIGGTWTSISGATIRGVGDEGDIGYIGTDTHILSIAELPAHGHGWFTTVNGTKKSYSANTISNAGYSWSDTFSGADAVDISSTDKINNSSGSQLIGGNEPHTNVQRSYNCYIWYRTA